MADWNRFIKSESEKDYFKNLFSFLKKDAKEHIIYPKSYDVFNAFKYTPLHKVKVCILGQDVYHGPNQAHGLSFSVPSGQTIPPSLRNIFKEINDDLQLNHSFTDGCLEPWAKQGVLLLNSLLTVRKGEPGSHKGKGWEIFTDNVISLLSKQERPIVFLLWGAFAKSKKELITNNKHLVLESGHPSFFSYHLFKRNKHFSKTNQFLIDNKLSPINWKI